MPFPLSASRPRWEIFCQVVDNFGDIGVCWRLAADLVSRGYGSVRLWVDDWAALRRIPAGETRSYGALAAEIGRPTAVRAVGLANGSNPIGIIVPCHRVIGANGALTGYAGGIERKRRLLTHEGAGFREPLAVASAHSPRRKKVAGVTGRKIFRRKRRFSRQFGPVRRPSHRPSA